MNFCLVIIGYGAIAAELIDGYAFSKLRQSDTEAFLEFMARVHQAIG